MSHSRSAPGRSRPYGRGPRPGSDQSNSATVARSTAVMALGTVASRLLGFVRAYVVALVLGIYAIGNVFSIANTLPNIVYLLIAGGVVNSVFVPQLVRARQEDEDGGTAYADRLLTVSGIGLLVVTVLAVAASPLLIGAYADFAHWHAPVRHLGLLMAFWCLPQIFFYGVYTMLGQVSNARGRFGPMMWAPIANNIVVIAIVGLFLWTGHEVTPNDAGSMSAGETALIAGGSTVGVIAQAVFLLPSLRAAGYTYRPRFDLRGAGLGRAASLAKWTIAFVAVNQVAYFLVTAVASDAGTRARGGNFAYQNAYLFFILPHSIITVSLVTALLPAMSAAAHAGRLAEVRSQVSEGLRTTGVLLAPVSLLLVVIGPPLGEGLFRGNNLSAADGRYIGGLLALFALGLVPFSAHHVLLRTFYAFQDTRTPFYLTCVVAATNSALALIVWKTVPVEHMTQALAAAYALTYWVGVLVAARVAARRLGGRGAGVLRTYVRAGVASLVAAFPAEAAVLLAADHGHAPLVDLGGAAVASVVMAGVYLWLARAMRLTELTSLGRALTGRLRRA